MKQLVMLSSALLLACGVGRGLAQADKSYPQKPVRIVVPWAAGGNADVLTRVMAQKLSDLWGQQVVVDNRGGANGMIGSELVVRSKPMGTRCSSMGCRPTLSTRMFFPKWPMTRSAT